MINQGEQKVYDVLDKLGIKYVRNEHIPVYTIEEADKLGLDPNGQHCKNLFLRNSKGDQHYLVVLDKSKNANLKELSTKINSTKLSFASEKRLDKYLALKPGSVSPFGLINDTEKHVKVIIDSDLQNAKDIYFHPNVNTATISLSYKDFERYLEWCGNIVLYVDNI